MTDEQLNALKREYNATINKSRTMYEELNAIAIRLHNIQDVVREHDPDALMHCIFAGEFEVDDAASDA